MSRAPDDNLPTGTTAGAPQVLLFCANMRK